MNSADMPYDPFFDRFDICEAYYLVECYYNVGGWLHERPSNQRRRESVGVQLNRMGFGARPDLGFSALTDNGKTIFLTLIERLKLPEWTEEDARS